MSSTSLSSKILDWDSQLFGFPVARLAEISPEPFLLKNTLNQLQREGVGLVYANTTGGEEIQALAAQAGGALVDRRVTYAAELSKTDPVDVPSIGEIVEFSGAVTPTLEALAFVCGTYSRFNVDPRIPREIFETLYRTWLAKSLSGALAERVFVARLDGQLCGFATATDEGGDCGGMGLLAVDERFRGRGFGRAFVGCARRHNLAMGRKFSKLVTQQSNPACRLYERLGYSVESTEFVFHFWLR